MDEQMNGHSVPSTDAYRNNINNIAISVCVHTRCLIPLMTVNKTIIWDKGKIKMNFPP